MNTTFPHAYECERLTETQGALSTHYYFPGASTEGGHDGMLVKIFDEGPAGRAYKIFAKAAGVIASAEAP